MCTIGGLGRYIGRYVDRYIEFSLVGSNFKFEK